MGFSLATKWDTHTLSHRQTHLYWWPLIEMFITQWAWLVTDRALSRRTVLTLDLQGKRSGGETKSAGRLVACGASDDLWPYASRTLTLLWDVEYDNTSPSYQTKKPSDSIAIATRVDNKSITSPLEVKMRHDLLICTYWSVTSSQFSSSEQTKDTLSKCIWFEVFSYPMSIHNWIRVWDDVSELPTQLLAQVLMRDRCWFASKLLPYKSCLCVYASTQGFNWNRFPQMTFRARSR